MTTATLPVNAKQHPNIRALNVLRDLSAVADLIELCFSSTMDNDGQRYVNDMRRASHDDGFLTWANRMAETTSLPLSGYVWEEDKKIVGNASLIPFRYKSKRIHLIANVATHPDHRGRGIARLLTERAVGHAREKKASDIWLHVRDDNPTAIRLYSELGFHEMARRTAWVAKPDSLNFDDTADIQITATSARIWEQQREWITRLYPDPLAWYHNWNFSTLKPGFWNSLYHFFADADFRQWAAVRGDELLATLTWMSQGGRGESLSLAAGSGWNEARERAVTHLLLRARLELGRRSSIHLDYPGGEFDSAISAAGFKPRRTLIWMKL